MMSEIKNCVVVIGGGPGGYVAALRAAQLGAQVTLIEKDKLGGTCLNRGCVPTKSLLQSASMLWQIKNADAFGISVRPPSLDFAAVCRRKQKVVEQLVDGVESLMRNNNVTVINGIATIAGPGKVRVVGEEEKTIEADKIIIATGSESASVPIEGIDEEGVIDSDEALTMEYLPKSMIIIGGGVIGLEFAQIFHRMDVKVAIIEMMPQILPTEDADIAQMLQEILKEEGIDIYTNAKVMSIGTNEQGNKIVSFSAKKGEKKLVVDKVLIAVGRIPYTKGLGLEKLGVALDRGRIVVNSRMETNIKDIYAIGDVVGGSMLAHMAMAEGICAAHNAVGMGGEMDYRAVPRCVYTSPEIAAVGLTEKEAEEKYDNVRVGRFPFRANAKALVLNEMDGMVKFIADAQYGQVLGVGIIGPHATEMIAETVLGIQLEATINDFASAIHAHPTLSEAVMEAALGIEGKSIHL
jgi:dihydrolipoamide dehydrogenase